MNLIFQSWLFKKYLKTITFFENVYFNNIFSICYMTVCCTKGLGYACMCFQVFKHSI